MFDVFGTVVDWRGSIIADLEAFGRKKGIAADWTALTDDWRGAYRPTLDRVIKGELPFARSTICTAPRSTGYRIRYGVNGLSEVEKDYVNKAWHRLNGWPDLVAGLTRLKRKYLIATLSNGNVALLTNMAKHAGLPWDCILSAELFRAYKKEPAVYIGACDMLCLKRDAVMLVAAHKDDLLAAQQQGLRTAFIPRPGEYGPRPAPAEPPGFVPDIEAPSFVALAEKLGA